MIKYFTNKTKFWKTAERSIKKTDVVLDIGCGIRPQKYFKPKVHILCEPYYEYIQELQKQKGYSNRIILMLKWNEVLKCLPEKSVDTIFLMDVIEHLPKKTGEKLLKKSLKIARKQIVIFTPLGFVKQHHEDGIDAWGFKGAKWQEHRSGWTPSNFSSDWAFFVHKNFHSQILINGKQFKPEHGAFFAINSLRNPSLTIMQRIMEWLKNIQRIIK